MDEFKEKNHIANESLPTDFALEEILAEFKAEGGADEPQESLSERSKRLVLETLPDALDADEFDALGGLIDSTVEEETPIPQPAPEPQPTTAPAQEPQPADEQLDELLEQSVEDTDEATDYANAAAVGFEEEEEEEPPEAPRTKGRTEQRTARERLLSPFIALAALVAMRRGQMANAEQEQPTPDEEDEEVPEMDPEKAAKLYYAQMRSLRFRGRVAAGLSIIMLYLSFAYYSASLPLTGMLHGNLRVLSLLLIIFEATVVITGLDIFTGGILGIFRRRMTAETLVSVSCIFSLIDAALTTAFSLEGYGLPFCAVSAISMTFAIWGAFYTCKGYRTGFRVLAIKKDLYTVTGESGITPDVALMKSRRGAYGFVHRSEEADLSEYVYGILTPILMVAAVGLGLLAGLRNGQPQTTMHCISILLAASATFSCGICYSVPYAVAAKKLYPSGAAIAGWSGMRDIGRSRHVIITDADVFPRGTVELGNIRVLEGTFTDKVISYTASVVAASGSGLAGPFADLVRRNGYTISKVENFEAHDGGGMTAMVNGESVCVGNTGFMNLMGIRLPQKLSTRSSLYTAINGSLVGIFTVQYKPVSSVQGALVQLLRSNLEPIFAIRDFNITPMMIKTKFKMPTDSFKFPPYAERFRISGAQPNRYSRVAAVIAREGMGPLVDVAERGRRAHLGVEAATIISAAGSVFGLIMMFMLCWLGAFDSASVSNVITFMLLWLIPIAVIVAGMHR